MPSREDQIRQYAEGPAKLRQALAKVPPEAMKWRPAPGKWSVQMVRALRKRFPRVPMMVNRGYDLLPRIVDEIDMVLGESVHSTYDVAAEAYVRVAPDAVRWQTDRLNDAKRLRPELKLFSLDYWSPTDREGIARIYAEARANGFVPYVATIDLMQIVPRS